MGVYRINRTNNSVGRINSRRVSAGVAVSWWLAGDIDPSNCVAAYQAKGAASYAASKVNLANPGTYDATEGVAPDWDTVNGWYSDGSKYLNTGVIPSNANWSYLINVEYANKTSTKYAFGNFASSTSGVNINYSAPSRRYQNGNRASIGGVVDGIFGIAGLNCYLDGSLDAAISSGGTVPVLELYLLGLNYTGGLYGMIGYIKSFAVYNTIITADQISALTTAMNAL